MKKSNNERSCGMNVRDIPCDLVAYLHSDANKNRRSLNSQIITILEQYVNSQKEVNKEVKEVA